MSWDNKVVWSEGMFLRPQHFQQHDRYVERLVRTRVNGLAPYPWGVTELTLNRELLTTGKFAVSACRGIFEDGTPFSVPGDADHPAPLVVPDNTRNTVVYLTVPVRQPGSKEVEMRYDATETTARYAAAEYESSDTNSDSEANALLSIGKLRMGYALENAERAGFVSLAIARIVEIRADKNIVLDERFIPSTLRCSAVPPLQGFITEILGLIHHRGEALSGRVSESGTKGAAEIADFLLLQTINRYEPLFSHLNATTDLHPERFYAIALELAGELATFTAQRKRPTQFPPYRHEDLQRTFQPLMADLRQSLSAVLEQTAVPIPLQERKYGIRVAPIVDRSLLTNSAFVLAVQADVPSETLRRHFPNQIKIGPVEQIRDLVNVALPGIKIRPLPVAPRQMPYHAGKVYFELERSGQYWKDLSTSGGFAMHVGGDFPGLQMDFWAIRGQ
jgi:type VI secretion system protein ImpJ